jgi:hypothetical protein
MKVLVDENEVAVSNSLSNLEEVLKELSETEDAKGRIVWTVAINSERYDEKVAHQARNIKVTDIKTLKITTMDQSAICELFQKNGWVILRTLGESAESIAGLMRRGAVKEANNHYRNFLETYHYLIYMLKLGADFGEPDADDEIGLSTSIAEQIPHLEGILKSMLEAQENEDWVMLADFLEYELTPLLNEWQNSMCRKEPERPGAIALSQ